MNKNVSNNRYKTKWRKHVAAHPVIELRHNPVVYLFGSILYSVDLGCRIKFQLPFNNIKWLSEISRH
jgi:hypothetical protein